jgi:hypothetical protein
LLSGREAATRLVPQVSPDARTVLEEAIERLRPGRPDLPEAIDLAILTAPGEPRLGKEIDERHHSWLVSFTEVGES